VIAVPLPEAGLIFLHELEPGHPLGTLPEVEVRYQEPHRSAMFGRERLAGIVGGQQVLLAIEIGQRQVRGVV
jgi:hypothetical protein